MPTMRHAIRKAVWRAVALLAVGWPGTVRATESLQVTFDAAKREMTISATGLNRDGRYALRLDTPGLSEPELGGNVNEPGIIYLPPREGPIVLTAKPAIPATAENVFFFHDMVAAAAEWHLVARFGTEASGQWKLNGRFSPRSGAIARAVRIPVAALELGENILHLEGPRPHAPELFLWRELPAAEAHRESFVVAGADWGGRVSLLALRDGAETAVAAEVHEGRALTRRDSHLPPRAWADRTRLSDAALAVGRNLLQAQVTDARSFFHGGFNLVYDTNRKAHRMPHWVWSWGPSIKFLLDLAQHPAAQREGVAQRFRDAAIAAGRRSLAFENTQAGHPASGISTVRWEPSRAAPNGWVEYMSTADSLFLAGWGWMPCHEATGDKVFLERTRSLVAAAERLMKHYPLVPQDWVVERERWTPHTLDESVFGMIGFRELHRATRSPAIAAAGRSFLDSHLVVMSRDSGLLERAWLHEERRAIWDPDIKGHAWVIEGYLDAHALSGEPKYLQLARALADRVVACQHEDGSWTYLFRQPKADDPRDDKGTAIWAYLFYEVYRVTRDERHLRAARRALEWCLRQQYRGEDVRLDGGLLNTNGMAYVRRRPMTILYSTTFLGLALLEELKLPPPIGSN